MPSTDYVAITQYIVDFLKTEGPALGIKAANVFYGDQELHPETPTVCVESGPYTQSLIGAPYRTDNLIVVYVLIYFAKIQDVQVTRKSCDAMARDIMLLLQTDRTMGDLVISGLVTSVEPGYAVRGNALLRAARLTWEGQTRTQLGDV